MLCKSCGGNVKSDFKYCPYCGERMIGDFHDQFQNLAPPFIISDADEPDDEPPEAMFDYPPQEDDYGAPAPAPFRRLPPLDDEPLDAEPFEASFDEDEPDEAYFVYRPETDAPRAKAPASSPLPHRERETHSTAPRPPAESGAKNSVGIGFKLFLIVLLLLVAVTITVFGYQLFAAQVPFGISELAAVIYGL